MSKDHMIRIRAHEDEVLAIKRLADGAGLSMSEYIRRRATGHAVPANAVALGRIAGDLGRIGGNINQLARAANTGKLNRLSEDDRTALRILARRIKDLRDVIVGSSES